MEYQEQKNHIITQACEGLLGVRISEEDAAHIERLFDRLYDTAYLAGRVDLITKDQIKR